LSKEKNISEFDSLFKQTFEGASSSVPPGVWEGVSAATTGVAGASSASLLSKLFGIKGAAILGSVAVIVTSTVLLTKQSDSQPEVETASNQTEIVVDAQTDKNESPDVVLPTDKLPNNETASNVSVDSKEKNNSQTPNNSVALEVSSNDVIQPDYSDNDVAGTSVNNPSNSEPTKSASTLTLSASSETICQGQKVDVSLLGANALKDVNWTVDGKPVVSNRKYMSFLFEKAGVHSIQLNATNSAGDKLSANQNIQVIEADASFKVSQKDGKMYLTSLKPVKSNQWYVNQVLVKENQISTSYQAETKTNVIVHVATNLNGCSDTARQEVDRVPNCAGDLKVPNIFTPYYQDGINDDFVIDMPQVEGYRLTVYNLKDGKVVFDTENQVQNWNGKYDNEGAMVPVGYYIYRLVYSCNGKTTTKQDRIMVSDAKN